MKVKLLHYLLNENHKSDGSKARWLRKALGFTKENWEKLAKQLKFDKNKAVPTTSTSDGQKYEQTITITGANGRVIDVKFIWIRNSDGVVRLVTMIPTKRK